MDVRPPLRRPWWIALIAALALLLGACAGSSVRPATSDDAHALAPTTPSSQPAAASEDAAALPALPPVLAPEVVRDAYRQITAQLYREVSPRELLVSAWKAVGDEARRQGLRSLNLDLYQRHGADDIDGFLREFESLLAGPARNLDHVKLSQAAVRGMAGAVGDSHTRFLTPEQAESQRRAAEGQLDTYSGIGVRIDQDPSGIAIAEVYRGSPAEKAGLRPGDVIVAVDGETITSRDVGEVSSRVRGREGTDVRLSILREGERLGDITVVRGRVVPPTAPIVSSNLLESGIGYIRIRSFPRRSAQVDAAREFDEQLAALLAQGARGIVLDLRGNPGGDPFTAVSVASNFVPQGVIFVSINREGKRTIYNAVSRATVFTGPLAVLTDRGSASGAEVVASAIQEYDAGRVIGGRTCGCLSVGRPLTLGDDSGLIVTVEQAVTGRFERSLEGVGLAPDEAIRGVASPTTDPVRERAVTYLRGQVR